MDDHLLRFDKDKTYVLIDCETENLCLNSFHNLPWQIAMIKTKGGEKVDEKDYYVKWDREINISPEAARITKFSRKTYENKAVSYKEIFPTIKDWLDEADYIVGHNILGFDIYLIKSFYEKQGEDYSHLLNKVLDTYCIAKGIKSNLPFTNETDFLEYQYKMLNKVIKGIKTNLKALGKEYNIDHDYENLHNALVDLELNLKVWNKLKWQVDI
jgi:DNA polymerase III epsilon subunit-like protein